MESKNLRASSSGLPPKSTFIEPTFISVSPYVFILVKIIGFARLCGFIDAVQYAGERWIAEIRKDLRRTGAEKEPLSHLVNAYIRGSEQHPDALNAYIDLWKKAKDGDVYIQKRLAAIYREYTIQFIRMVREEIGLDPDMDTLETVAQWLTILSDVLHIQSLVLGNPVDFEKMGQTVSRAVSLLLRGESS